MRARIRSDRRGTGPTLGAAAALPLLAALMAPMLGHPRPAAAQVGAWPVSGGLGGANVALARGFQALEWNPANLGRARAPRWSMALMSFGASAVSAGTSLVDLADIATAEGEGDPALVGRVPEQGLTVELLANGFGVSRVASVADLPDPAGGVALPDLAMSWGPFALQIQSGLQYEGSVSREITDLMVNGYDPERVEDYAIKNTSFRGVSWTAVTLGAGYPLTSKLAVGASLRGILGNKLIQGRLFEPTIDLDAETLTLAAVAVESPGAKGFALDVGTVYEPRPGVVLGFSVRNLVQRLTWDDALVAYSSEVTDADFDTWDLDDVADRFQGEDVDPLGATLQIYQAAEGLFDQSFFPRILRVGGGLSTDWGGSLHLAWSTTQGKGKLTSPWDDRISLGVEQRLWAFTLRGGWASASSGMRALTGGFGLRIGPVNLDAMGGTVSGTSDSGSGLDYDGLMGTFGLSLVGR